MPLLACLQRARIYGSRIHDFISTSPLLCYFELTEQGLRLDEVRSEYELSCVDIIRTTAVAVVATVVNFRGVTS